MKGIELPISALIIIALALLVLLGIIALWLSGWGGGSSSITLESVKEKYCGELMRYYEGCTARKPSDIIIFDFDADRDGVTEGDTGGVWCWSVGDPDATCVAANSPSICGALGADGNPGTADDPEDSLAALCRCWFNAQNAADCRKLCGCGG